MGFNPAAVVQERTFVYNNDRRLQSVTHPESGTSSYSCQFDGTVKDKTDAMGQKTQWNVRCYNWGWNEPLQSADGKTPISNARLAALDE